MPWTTTTMKDTVDKELELSITHLVLMVKTFPCRYPED